MPRATMTPVSRLMSQSYGDPAFWDFFRGLIQQRNGVRNFSFADWENVLNGAREAGLLDLDGEGENANFVSPFGMAILRLWRAMKSAQSRGMSARQFYAEYDATLEIERAETAVRVREYDRARATQFQANAKGQKAVLLPTGTDEL